MYEYDVRVRYTECDSKGNMKPDAIIDCFQNAFYFECEATGFGVDYLSDAQQGWFIYFWQLDIIRYPRYGENITVGTFSYSDKGNTEERNFYLRDSQGKFIVKANSIWSLVDLLKKQIIRLPKKITECEHKEKIEMYYQKRRIQISNDLEIEEIGEHIVNVLEIDSNNHLNNSSFLKIVLSEDNTLNMECISRICIEYKKQVLVGDIIKICKARYSDYTFFELKSISGETCAIVTLNF